MFSKRVAFTIAALVLSTSVLAAGAQERNSNLENFKREMMPEVGKKITVVGVMQSAKLGWLVSFKKWGVYIYAVNDSGIRLMNDFNRFAGQTVQVTGTLRYFPEPATSKSDLPAAVPPEHFYFDVSEVKVVGLGAPRAKRLKRGRGRKALRLSASPDNSFNTPPALTLAPA